MRAKKKPVSDNAAGTVPFHKRANANKSLQILQWSNRVPDRAPQPLQIHPTGAPWMISGTALN
jgi:hypothetical protein